MYQLVEMAKNKAAGVIILGKRNSKRIFLRRKTQEILAILAC